MLTRLAILIMLSFLSGCAKGLFSDDAENKLSKQEARKNFSLQFPKDIFYPVLFAHFSWLQDSSPNMPKTCALSPLWTVNSEGAFKVNDICAPTPGLAKNTDPKDHEKIVWTLSRTPDYFYWQQNLKPEQNLIVELIDSDGLPWPTSVTITQEENLFTVRLKTTHELPKTRELFLVGSIVGKQGAKIETWLLPLMVLEGSDGTSLWAPVNKPVPAKTPPKNTSKKSSKQKKSKKSKRI